MNLNVTLRYESTRTDSQDWKGDYQIWLPLLVASWALAYAFQDPFVSDWDGFDYAANAVRNVPTALGLGRALFLAYNHALWEIAHRWLDAPPEHSYLVLRYGVILQSGPAVVGIYALYKELTASRLASTCGTLMVALSPFYIIYSGRGMTEIPAFLMLGWSLWWMLRSLRLKHLGGYFAAAALFGLSANMREFACFYLPMVPLAAYIHKISWRRWAPALIVTALAMIAGAIFWSLYRPDYYLPAVMNWLRLSAIESERNPVTARNFGFLGAYGLWRSAAATVIAPFALIQVCRRFRANRRLCVLLLLGALGLLADLALAASHDLLVNPRYLLTGLIGIAVMSGWFLAEWIKSCSGWKTAIPVAIAICLTIANLIGAYPHVRNEESAARASSAYLARLEGLPAEAVFIVGARTPLVNFYNNVGARPLWKTIPAGSAWPDDKLSNVIDGYLADGIPVYVDFDQSLWDPGSRSSRESPGLEMIWRDYQLDLARSPLLYQISRKQPAYPGSIGGGSEPPASRRWTSRWTRASATSRISITLSAWHLGPRHRNIASVIRANSDMMPPKRTESGGPEISLLLPHAFPKNISEMNGGHDEDPAPVYRHGSVISLRGGGSPTEAAPARQRDLYGHGVRRQS